MRFSASLTALAVLIFTGCLACHGQAALLLEQPYALSRIVNPTGHVAMYFARVCAATPTRLRRCRPGELGAVIARYHGIGGYDWVAMPLVPYLYAVENPASVPARTSRAAVGKLRKNYHRKHLLALGARLGEGGFLRRGWNQLAGASYNRRIYALSFATTPAQDDRFIAWMNERANRTHFHILWNNCADFMDELLDFYFPGAFGRRILPDGGIVTPRQVAHQLQSYARKHPDLDLTIFEIPQIPGNHLSSTRVWSVTGSLIAGGYIVPIAIVAPYAAAGIGADFLIWGRYPLRLKRARVLSPKTLALLDGPNVRPDAARTH